MLIFLYDNLDFNCLQKEEWFLLDMIIGLYKQKYLPKFFSSSIYLKVTSVLDFIFLWISSTYLLKEVLKFVISGY
jgi:hypothetical protein